MAEKKTSSQAQRAAAAKKKSTSAGKKSAVDKKKETGSGKAGSQNRVPVRFINALVCAG